MLRPCSIGLVLGLGLACGPTQETSAKRLGFRSDERVLIIHADDLGLSHATNTASIAVLTKGSATSASIMVPCPWFPEIAAYAREHREIDFGIHLTLTSEWENVRWRSVASSDKVPSLLDESGFLWKSERLAAQHAKPSEVATELRAQIELAKACGIEPTHLDTHMGTLYLSKDLFEVFVKLGSEYHLSILAIRPTAAFVELMQRKNSPIDAERLAQLEKEGVLLVDHFPVGIDGATHAERKASYHALLRRLEPGLTEITMHPCLADEESQALLPPWETRYSDYLTFTDPETKHLIDELGITLTTWRELNRRTKALDTK